MALRVFQSNPAIGGFGGESSGQLDYYINTNDDDAHNNASSKDKQSSSEGGQTNAKQSQRQPSSVGDESCDAFVQIVKELVDNAVDACARDENNVGADYNVDQQQKHNTVASSKRVRVEIKPTQISTGGDDDDDDDDGDNTTAMMECFRVKVSDNGCGMEDIDACVSAFRSTKNNVDDGVADKIIIGKGGGSKSNKKNNSSSKKKKNIGGSGAKNKQAAASYTSGRYGVGLTLCLLHAQRLVPNSVTLIITSTKTSDYWTIRRYRADTEKDEIVCLKEERLPKIDKDECGTIVEILVPGGQGAISAWPRLAEYFARFQLSIELPCSIEVKAEALQPLPLYVRPPRELERRMCRKKMNGKENDVENGSVFNEEEDEEDDDDDWGDGFDEGAEETENKASQSVSKASLERARVEEDKKRKRSLMQKAACLYKGRRVDLRNVDVAYSMQRIRSNNEVGKSTSQAKTCPILEMSMIVFGQEITDNDDDSLEDTCCDKTAKLHIVRMVNGIPVLDSSEALACGVITKISNNPTIWNSFGLDIRQRDQQTAGCPTFDINDSGQVAPFLRTSTHSLYSQSQDDVFSASDQDDNDDFDLEDMHSSARRKRKNEQQARCILPAAERLGDVMIVVQIRAKPSALPLSTLSKGRLPMNNKSIDNAVENAVTDCLRTLQTQNPRLLLTAQQLKKVERDVKYAPLVAGAIASVLSRSRKQGLYQHTVNVSSCWDDEIKKLGLPLGQMSVSHRNKQGESTLSADNEREKSQTLGRMIERRLRFVVSDEFRAHQKAEEMEHRRQRREELAAERKKAKTESKVTESDGLNSDVFGSDEDSTCSIISERNKMSVKDESEGFVGDGFQSDDSSNNDVGDVETVREKNGDKVQEDDDSWSSEFGECVDISFFR